MRKHGWQLPYHPLQVVAVAVFLALGFAFYVFFAPFLGRKLYQYIVMGIYTPLILCVFGLYIWCAAADPADPGVFKSKKYLKTSVKQRASHPRKCKFRDDSASSICEPNVTTKGDNMDRKSFGASVDDFETESVANASLQCSSWLLQVFCLPCSVLCKCMNGGDESSDRQTSEDGMFYCSLCEVEVFKYSKHCRVCDKCVDSFDHHCRWLNNCIGKKNYRKFFTLMVFAQLLLILQWSTGILVLVYCFLDRKRFSADIVSKLGSSFTIVPYVIVVVVCTILAMIATLPLAQLFFFHILLIKKGISTYDYIIALREQEQQGAGGQQSPQMSQVSSLTGLSSTSSFNTFHRAAWCTPPRLFVEDQYDVVPPDNGSVSSYGKKMAFDEPSKKKNPAVKISPWTLARLNADEVSRAAAEARKKSKILQPIASRREKTLPIPGHDTDSSVDGSGRLVIPRLDSNRRRPPVTRAAATSSGHVAGSSPESSLESPDHRPFRGGPEEARRLTGPGPFSAALPGIEFSGSASDGHDDRHPFRVSSCGPEEARRLTGLGPFSAALPGIEFSRSTSDGYEASGGEDSDRVPTTVIQGGQANWSSLLFGSNGDQRPVTKLKSSAAGFNVRKR